MNYEIPNKGCPAEILPSLSVHVPHLDSDYGLSLNKHETHLGPVSTEYNLNVAFKKVCLTIMLPFNHVTK